MNCAFIRKLRVSAAKGKEESIQQEEEFITSLREKLQTGSVCRIKISIMNRLMILLRRNRNTYILVISVVY